MNLISKKGVAVLYAVLVTSVVLAVGVGVGAIALKEGLIAAAGRDSQLAFFIADTGAECAFYWDRKFILGGFDESVFATSSDDTRNIVSGVRCGNTDIAATGGAGGGVWNVQKPNNTTATTVFVLRLTGAAPNPNPCATVTVTKTKIGTGSGIATKVTSVGQSICDPTNPRVVQRSVEANY